MGRKLADLAAAALIVIVLGSPAAAETAADLVKQGLDEYKAGNYPAAALTLARAYELEASFDTLFALAQAERLAGQCDKAIPRYKALLDASTDLSTGRLVQTSMALCQPPEPEKPAPPPPPPPPPPPKPEIIVRQAPPSIVTTSLFAGGGAALGASIVLFVASRENRSDADAAVSFDDHEKISRRADRQRIAAYVTLAASAGLVGTAIYRLKFRKTSTEVAIAPSEHGAVMVAWGRW